MESPYRRKILVSELLHMPYICRCKTRNHRAIFWKKVSLQLRNDKFQILYQEAVSTKGQHTTSGILQWIKIKHTKHHATHIDDLVTCPFLITFPHWLVPSANGWEKTMRPGKSCALPTQLPNLTFIKIHRQHSWNSSTIYLSTRDFVQCKHKSNCIPLERYHYLDIYFY